MATKYITAIHMTIDKKVTKVYIRLRDFKHLDETKAYFGATIGQRPIVSEKQPDGGLVYKAEIVLTAEKADAAMVELGTLDFHETKKPK